MGMIDSPPAGARESHGASLDVRDGVRVGIIHGYPRADREDLDRSGMTSADQLYIRILEKEFPDFRLDTLYLADPDWQLEQGTGVESFDAYIWTGSKLTIYDDDPRVKRQIEFSRKVFQAGKPQFGSCWGAQMAAVAAGGEVKKMPQGRETFLARDIQLTGAGRQSPLYEGKTECFDVFVNHLDEVTTIPPGGVLLAEGSHCHVQALEVVHRGGIFWGLQYHPEYNLQEMAKLMEARGDALVEEGFFPDRQSLGAHTAKSIDLHRAPENTSLREELKVGPDILGKELREAELRNFFHHLVLPSLSR